ncbi:hypothetical protein BHE74_00013554 [Ensete ventricosum]|nr:hypothetical protein BHE74_00013554 [Ensete ventricosum]
MKGYGSAGAGGGSVVAPPASKRRWKGQAAAVLALVVFSLLVPLAFLLGLHNRFPSVRQVTDTRTARYLAVLPKSTVGDRLREKKEEEVEKKKEEEEKKKEDLLSPRHPRPRAITARRPRPWAILLPHEETECLPTQGERSR